MQKHRFFLILIFVVAVLIRVNRLAQTGLTGDERPNLTQGSSFYKAMILLLH